MEKVHLRMHCFKICGMVRTDEKLPPFKGWRVISLIAPVPGVRLALLVGSWIDRPVTGR